jgi:HSP20 family protein
MLVRYWHPWREMDLVRHQLNQLFNEMQAEPQTDWRPAVELQDAGEQLIVRAQIPGLDAKDLDIQVAQDAVSIRGERRQESKTETNGVVKSEFRYGTFHRVVALPVAVQNNQVRAEYKDGILTLTLPKLEEVRNKVVKVSLSGATPTDAALIDEMPTESSSPANHETSAPEADVWADEKISG